MSWRGRILDHGAHAPFFIIVLSTGRVKRTAGSRCRAPRQIGTQARPALSRPWFSSIIPKKEGRVPYLYPTSKFHLSKGLLKIEGRRVPKFAFLLGDKSHVLEPF
jgi:hypothetical protein